MLHMLQATLVNSNGAVGVAPSTTTLLLKPANGRTQRRVNPYADLITMRGGGLGLINPGDWWMTGRPYGLPGTTVVRIHPDGRTSLEGAGLGAELPPDINKEIADGKKRTYIVGAIAGGIGLLGLIVALVRK
jgi:hypothetical protein